VPDTQTITAYGAAIAAVITALSPVLIELVRSRRGKGGNPSEPPSNP
jgi:hypothetical protein